MIVRVLEDQAHRRPYAAQAALFYGQAADLHLALAAQNAVEVQHQGGLARPVGAHQSYLLPWLDDKRYPAQGGRAIRILKR